MKEKRHHANRLIAGAFFTALLLFWGLAYPEHLVQKEQMQLFLWSLAYLNEHLIIQGGLISYLGEFLTQFFLYKWVAAAILSGILLSLYAATNSVLRKLFGKPSPLLAVMPAIGYHFLLLNDDYYLSGALALSLTIWALAFCCSLTKQTYRIISGILFIPVIYWLLGGAYLVFLLSVCLVEWILFFRKDHRKMNRWQIVWVIPTLLITGSIIPLMARRYVILDTLLQSYLSHAYYKFSFILPPPLIAVFLAVPLVIMLQGAFHAFYPRKSHPVFRYAIATVLLIVAGFGCYHLHDFEEEKEMKYDNLVYRQQWEQIIELARQEPPVGKQGKLALTLALGQTDRLSSQLFQFNPGLHDFFIAYKVHGMAPLMAQEPYFYLGLTNFSQMLCIETIESTPDAARPVRAMKRYAENCLINGQYDVAARYLRYLQQTLFYRNWANEALQYLHDDEKIQAHPLWGKLRSYRVKDDFYYQFDQPETMLAALLRSNLKNKTAYEYLMSRFLLKKDFDEFLKYLPIANQMNYRELPLTYQEVLAYVETLLPEIPENLAHYAISEPVRSRLTAYAQTFQQGGHQEPELMQKLYGDTYWYYVHFIEQDED
ncbi:MAG: DUF6057 family protein [Mangrovibacterium sp.]